MEQATSILLRKLQVPLAEVPVGSPLSPKDLYYTQLQYAIVMMSYIQNIGTGEVLEIANEFFEALPEGTIESAKREFALDEVLTAKK